MFKGERAMTVETKIYHNPRCSKSRQTLALLTDKGIEPTVIEYLKDGLDASTVQALMGLLGVEPGAILRKKEDAYTASGLDASSSKEEIIDQIVAHPILLERPIVVHGKKAAMGRPPENVLSILD